MMTSHFWHFSWIILHAMASMASKGAYDALLHASVHANKYLAPVMSCVLHYA